MKLVYLLAILAIGFSFIVLESEAILPENLPEQSQAPYHVRVIEGENIIAYAIPLYTSHDDPSNHEVPTSDPHDGVAKLILTRTDGTFGCSGTLANDRQHVITAAHCVADDNGNFILISGSAEFRFCPSPRANPRRTITSRSRLRHPRPYRSCLPARLRTKTIRRRNPRINHLPRRSASRLPQSRRC